ncbi:YCF48-related protein [Solimonas marina]|uniref:Photosynthesis system II assembly factor Ycf48/Hcf136-like domain-containing protein n=1 Tax=Solimonas marina TaxID=2714601 RepID=A0A969WBX3_9GAMM|nr:YCF48-related protein [Solimonas marina]NKF24536.1 hypothetical protein [Solimonas marina]
MKRRHLRLKAGFVACAAVAAMACALPTAGAEESVSAGSAQPAKPIPALLVAHPERSVMFDVKRTGSHFVAVGAHGVILRSADGERWQQIASPVDTALTWVSFAGGSDGWAVGHDAVILHTADGGDSWSLQNFQPSLDSPIFSVVALDAKTAIAVGAFGLLKRTADGGEHWSDVEAPELTTGKYHLFAVTRLRDGKLFAVGEAGLMGVSDDTGQSWKKLDAIYDGPLFGVLPWREHGAVAYGLLGNIYMTDDVVSGPWKKLDGGPESSIFGGMTLDDGGVLLVGANGTEIHIAADGHLLDGTAHGQSDGSGTWTSVAATPSGLVLAGEPGLVDQKE